MSGPSDYVIVIPARFASERLPGKVLEPIGDVPMLAHVWRAARASAAREVVIATDDERIAEAAKQFGADVEMTRPDHASGSDRIAECAARRGWDDTQLIVNLQGDEPEMPPACLDQVAGLLDAAPQAAAATLCCRITDSAEVEDPGAVKVVVDQQGRALYFSRSVIPHNRGGAAIQALIDAGRVWLRHIGLYAYRHAALSAFTRWPATPLERAERLEQLRFLEHGQAVMVAEACAVIPPGVDTPDDLRAARARML